MPQFKRSLPLLALVGTTFLLTPVAHAQAGQDDSESDAPGANSPAKVLNRVLGVLQLDPPSASDSCVNALQELHKTQQIVANDEGDSSNSAKQELDVARDVLESDYDRTNEICGADARTLCRTKGTTLPKAPALCAGLHSPVPSPDQ